MTFISSLKNLYQAISPPVKTALKVFITGTAYQHICSEALALINPEANPDIIARANKIAKEMGIKKPIQYLKDDDYLGLSLSAFPNRNIVVLPDTVDDFVIAHELVHIKKQHVTQFWLLLSANMAFWKIVKTSAPHIPRTLRGPACIASSFALHKILGRRNERQADIEACKYISNDAVAEGVRLFDRVHKLRQIEINRVNAIGTIFEKISSKVIHRFDSHPSEKMRINYLKKIYYQQATNTPLAITTVGPNPTTELASTSDSKRIAELLKNSPQEDLLINFKAIKLTTGIDEYNLHLGLDVAFTKFYCYKVDPTKIDAYIKSGRRIDILECLVEEAVNSPHYIILKIEGDAPLEESLRQCKLIYTDYDFDTLRPLIEQNKYVLYAKKKD